MSYHLKFLLITEALLTFYDFDPGIHISYIPFSQDDLKFFPTVYEFFSLIQQLTFLDLPQIVQVILPLFK